MEVIEAIRLPKSIRGYKPDPVPKEVLREIRGIATRAPFALNVQPGRSLWSPGKFALASRVATGDFIGMYLHSSSTLEVETQ